MSEILGFTIDQAARVSGLSQRQLRYWDKTDFFPPGFLGEHRRAGLRLYTFRDLVGLRALAELRKRYGVSLQELRKTAFELSKRHDSPWSSLTLYVAGRQVYFDDPLFGALVAARSGNQTAMRLPMKRVASETQAEVDRLKVRELDQVGKIDQKRSVAQNEPVMAGTRVPTAAVWNLHRGGYSEQAILREYPALTVSDVRAALAFERKRSRKAG